MKVCFKIFLFIIVIFYNSVCIAESKIIYIDVDYILNNSNVGKKKLESINVKKKGIESKLIKTENQIKEEEKNLLAQKNVINENEYIKKVNDLKIKIIEHNKNKNNKMKELTIEATSLSQNLLEKLKPIIEEYSIKNNISLVLQKEDIVLGRSELDVTDEILKIFNNKVKEI